MNSKHLELLAWTLHPGWRTPAERAARAEGQTRRKAGTQNFRSTGQET